MTLKIATPIKSKNDIFKAVGKLKSDKIDVEGRVLSNNYIHGTDYLFMYLSFCSAP